MKHFKRGLALGIGLTLVGALAGLLPPSRSGLIGATGGAANPVPLISQPLVPDAVAPGGAGFTLTVNGTGFVSGSVVNWNGSARAMTFVSSSQLTATIAAADIATAGTASVTVVSPGPGGGTSNTGFFEVTNSTSSISLSGATFATGAAPFSVTTGDFNGDGRLDLAVANQGGAVSVLLGNGDGTFQARVDYPAGSQPVSVVAGDFNGDGRLDLAVANDVSDTVSILLGNGDGTFQAHVDYATGSAPISVATGDFNGDGKLDLAIADHESPATVSILLGNGDRFQSRVDYVDPLYPFSVTIGDFNGDGALDLAVANVDGPTVSIFLGNGDGTFQAAVDYATYGGTGSIAAADFNGDGKLDLAVSTDASAGAVSVLLGNGDGTFQTHHDYPVGAEPLGLTTGDLNGDGILDLATANSAGNGNTLSILLGNGDGTFQARSDYPTLEPRAVTTGDFDADGTLDLVAANYGSNTVSVLLNTTVRVSPVSLIFATQVVGTASANQKVKLANTGSATLTISSIAIGGADPADFAQSNSCGISVAPGASCGITVRFKPIQKGTRVAAITITDNAPASPQSVSLTGAGIVAKLSPTSINFGNHPVGTTSKRTVTLVNVSPNVSLAISKISIGGTNFGSFAETSMCPASLAPGATCTVNVTFSPKTTGPKSATLDIYDDGGANPQTVALSGTGT